MRTRSDYLEGRCTHQEYYLEIAKEIGLTCDAKLLVRVRESVDKHLNDIPLLRWDAAGAYIRIDHRTIKAFKARGDCITDAGMVSLLKVFYLDAATKE